MIRLPQRFLSAVACVIVAFGTLVAFSPAAFAEECEPESRDDKLGETPWPLKRLQPERVWPLSRGKGVKVAVIDSGVGEHPVLAGKVTAYDLADDDRGARCDMASHGTLIAGIIAGSTRDDTPFHGVAPDAEILSYRVIENMDSSTSKDSVIPIVNAVRQATADGADVINMSLTAVHTSALEDAIADAIDAGIVIVAAAGNKGAKAGREYPAAYDDVIAVGGINQEGTHVDSSSIGDYVDIAAPGEEIDGPAPAGGGYGRRQEGGTSFAAPYVSAAAALLKAYHPKATPQEISARLLATADHPPEGWNPIVGFGELNLYRAMTTVLPDKIVEPDRVMPASAPKPQIDEEADIRAYAFRIAMFAILIASIALLAKVVFPRGRARGWKGR